MDKVFITPQMATEFLQRNNSNRAISEATLKRYVVDMKNGYWSETPIPIVFDEYGVLLDGQHRLSALVKANKSFYFYIATDKRENYSKYDIGKKRSPSDLLSSNGYKNTILFASVISSVAKYIENEYYRKSLKPEDYLKYVEKHKDNYWREILAFTKRYRAVFNPSVPLSIYLLLKHSYKPHEIMLYLNDIATLDNQETNIPTLVYRYIMEYLKSQKTNVYASDYFDVILTGFIHYINGNNLKHIRVRDRVILLKELNINKKTAGFDI